METFHWNQLCHTRVVKQSNDPRLKKKESIYILEHVVSKSTGKIQLAPVTDPNWFGSGGMFNRNSYQLIRNKAISKVEDKLQMFDNLFEAFYERNEALTMMRKAGTQVLRFVTSWRKPNYWRSLMKGAKRPGTLPEAWLMYNFGLKPLIASIDSAAHLLGSDIPPFFVRASSGGKLRDSGFGHIGPYSRFEANVEGEAYAQFRVWIRPELNPNRGLMNVMGLTTPFSTALSVVPWAWAVDYFVNLSDQIANFEDRFPGVEISEVWETNYFSGKTTGEYWDTVVGNLTNSGSVVHVRRQPSSLHKRLTFNVPMFGTNKLANLFSAIALTMKGKQK